MLYDYIIRFMINKLNCSCKNIEVDLPRPKIPIINSTIPAMKHNKIACCIGESK